MKNWGPFIFILLLIPCHFTMAANISKAIYGRDDRYNANSSVLKAMHLRTIRATAAQVNKRMLKDFEQTAFYKLTSKDYKTLRNLCPGEEEMFKDEMSGLDCSGFLVGEDTLISAAHCFKSSFKCRGYSWVFDFKSDILHTRGHAYIEKRNVYDCKEVLHKEQDSEKGIDYAIVKLDRKVEGRPFLQLQSHERISDNAKLFTVGHPSGLPVKVSLNGQIINNEFDHYFTTDLDTFVGNSGSPVLNEATGLVEGILTRGHLDFSYDKDLRCNKVIHCTAQTCDGEAVMRASAISGL